MKNTLPTIEEQKKAVTVKEIKEYIDDYPYELLTPEEENRVRDEIVYEKNGGCILDGVLTELDEKMREKEDTQYYNKAKYNKK